MEKDEKLFEDQIDESNDLLNISLDDLSNDVITEPVNGEPDQDIIELMDLLEKGDAALFGDDTNDMSEKDDIPSHELSKIHDLDTDFLAKGKEELDDIFLDAGISGLGDEPESVHSEDVSDDQLSDKDSLDDMDDDHLDSDNAGDELEKLLNETELDDLSDDTEALLSDDAEDYNMEIEELPNLDTILGEDIISDKKITHDSAPGNIHDSLLNDFDMKDDLEENQKADDEPPDILDVEIEKTIVSSEEDNSKEKSLWGIDTQVITDDAETLSVPLKEEMTLDEESLEYSGNDTEDTDDLPLDDIPLDGKSFDELFSETEFNDETVSDEYQSESIGETFLTEEDQIKKADDSTGSIMDDTFKGIETRDNVFSDELKSSRHDEAGLASGSLLDGITEEIFSTDIESPVISADDFKGSIETQISGVSNIEETTLPDDSQTDKDIPVAVSPQPLISEEKLQEIVTKVVGEVVERVAREVFAEVAEKVIAEAIGSLKKSLEVDSE